MGRLKALISINPELIAYIDSLTQPAKRRISNRVAPWMQECFGTEISNSKVERTITVS